MGILTPLKSVVELSGRTAAQSYAQTTLNTDTASTVTRASGASGIWVAVESGTVRVRTDGTSPTATVGEPIGAGVAALYAVASLEVIESSAEAVIQTWSE